MLKGLAAPNLNVDTAEDVKPLPAEPAVPFLYTYEDDVLYVQSIRVVTPDEGRAPVANVPTPELNR